MHDTTVLRTLRLCGLKFVGLRAIYGRYEWHNVRWRLSLHTKRQSYHLPSQSVPLQAMFRFTTPPEGGSE